MKIAAIIWTVLCLAGFVWFIVTVQGEDTMALPFVMMAAIVAIAGAWGLYGVVRAVIWWRR